MHLLNSRTFAALLVATANAGAADAPSFQKQILTGKYYCDGITAGDINRDGKPDIVAGPFWYAGPDFKTAHELQAVANQ